MKLILPLLMLRFPMFSTIRVLLFILVFILCLIFVFAFFLSAVRRFRIGVFVGLILGQQRDGNRNQEGRRDDRVGTNLFRERNMLIYPPARIESGVHLRRASVTCRGRT